MGRNRNRVGEGVGQNSTEGGQGLAETRRARRGKKKHFRVPPPRSSVSACCCLSRFVRPPGHQKHRQTASSSLSRKFLSHTRKPQGPWGKIPLREGRVSRRRREGKMNHFRVPPPRSPRLRVTPSVSFLAKPPGHQTPSNCVHFPSVAVFGLTSFPGVRQSISWGRQGPTTAQKCGEGECLISVFLLRVLRVTPSVSFLAKPPGHRTRSDRIIFLQ